MGPRPDRLNKYLDVRDLKVLVPQDLFAGDNPTGAWTSYRNSLAADCEGPVLGGPPETKDTCDGKSAFVLRGEMAVKHACKVHQRMHGHLLRFPGVTAVDVGFAVFEQKQEFAPLLALRVHVERKKSAEELHSSGTPALNHPFYLRRVRKAFADRASGEVGKDLRRKICIFLGLKPDASENGGAVPSDLIEWSKQGLSGPGSPKYKNYPLAGVTQEALSAIDPFEDDELAPGLEIWKKRRLQTSEGQEHRCRICVFGLPIDIIDAQYFPSAFMAESERPGVFVSSRQTTDELSNSEQALTGRGRVEPIVGGVSVGGVSGRRGTLSAVVWDRTDGSPCLLGNWHVLAGRGSDRVGQACYQPALFDGATENDAVARLKRWHLGESGDAALAELVGDRRYASGEVLGMWHPVSGVIPPRLNMEIRKWGRTTGYTRGFIDGIQLAANIDYGDGDRRYFSQQFHIAPVRIGEEVSRFGDSGALVLTSFEPEALQRDLGSLERNVDGLGKKFEECWATVQECEGDEAYESVKSAFSDPDYTKLTGVGKAWEFLEQLLSRLNDKDNENSQDASSQTPVNGAKDTMRVEIERFASAFCESRSEVQLEEIKIFARDLDPMGAGFAEARIIKQLKVTLSVMGPGMEEARDRELEKLMKTLQKSGIEPERIRELVQERIDKAAEKVRRRQRRAYYAVGMIFAGDSAGSPFGEFALASDVSILAEKLRFSLRPVFAARSGFRDIYGGVGATHANQPNIPTPMNAPSQADYSSSSSAATRRSGGPQTGSESASTGKP